MIFTIVFCCIGILGFDVAESATLRRVERGFGVSPQRLWPDGAIPYTLDAFPSTAASNIEKAMKIWEDKTCIRFVPKTNYDGDSGSLHIVNSDSPCRAQTGYYGAGGSTAFLGESYCGSSIQILVHEMGHVIGLKHEDLRPDKDQFIIPSPAWEKTPDSDDEDDAITEADLQSLTPYDYLSVMHPPSLGIASSARWGRYRKTMNRYNTKNPCYQQFVGHSILPSFLDIKGVNDAYKCGLNCPTQETQDCAKKGPSCYVGGPNCACHCPASWPDPCRQNSSGVATPVECPNWMWQCPKKGRCIEKEWICDQYPDCDDGEDEVCSGFYFCPNPNDAESINIAGSDLDCPTAVSKFPRLVCNKRSPFVDACCLECHARNVSTAICYDFDGCQSKTHAMCTDPMVRNDCPYLCGLCYKNECSGYDQCLNGGLFNIFCDCVCPSGFTGDKCEAQICKSESCSSTCSNGGTPVKIGTSMTCLCQSGFVGSECECRSGISVSVQTGTNDWDILSCENAHDRFPKTTCLKHASECCGECEKSTVYCHDEPKPDGQSNSWTPDCSSSEAREKWPVRCGQCLKDECPGTHCLNGGTLTTDCVCQCPPGHPGPRCEETNMECEGPDVWPPSICQIFTTVPETQREFCKSDSRLYCCNSCRTMLRSVAHLTCEDDPDNCGDGKKFWHEFFCYRRDTAEEAAEKCPKLCGKC